MEITEYGQRYAQYTNEKIRYGEVTQEQMDGWFTSTTTKCGDDR